MQRLGPKTDPKNSVRIFWKANAIVRWPFESRIANTGPCHHLHVYRGLYYFRRVICGVRLGKGTPIFRRVVPPELAHLILGMTSIATISRE